MRLLHTSSPAITSAVTNVRAMPAVVLWLSVPPLPTWLCYHDSLCMMCVVIFLRCFRIIHPKPYFLSSGVNTIHWWLPDTVRYPASKITEKHGLVLYSDRNNLVTK
ncbi:hypothetical protein BZA05DRAFT_398890 [Tricharina praecox]|uniref:uncharacterized protein n=1 Tax=Tricharina praecox TaxID=43433 RepID=UPI00221EE507|nr:uncharacterized protein BZA05DRAFT_398890 [Tricharina praecox]KAI5850840.1 hypothetical protein BZA05DRAFT_398890 [Tricharina praecox]